MANGRAALFGLSGTALRGRDRPTLVELAAVQGVQLNLRLLVYHFHLLALPPLLIQLFAEISQVVFVVTFRTRDLLTPMKDPTGGQALQIRAPIPVRAAAVGGQVLKLRHNQSGGGNWSRRHLASESRCSSVHLGGVGGVANATYARFTQTNVATPAVSWTPIRTNQFDSLGVFQYTNVYNPTERQRYFLLLEQL